ncbi:MAG: hypothetical protein PHQ23_07655, partial [Candidatus Wallbacteria bacterium]|nr:hypothetical protein [Candidatus Wallbacteria bacterium]
HRDPSAEISVGDILNHPALIQTQTWSLTGGEPLLQASFIKKLLAGCSRKILLETNGTLPEAFSSIRELVDVVSMDLKPEAGLLDKQIEFARLACCRELYFKLVITAESSLDELLEYLDFFKGFSRCLFVLQPEFSAFSDTLRKALMLHDSVQVKFPRVRIIPQVHKWMGVK